jgi:hypothetical protein
MSTGPMWCNVAQRARGSRVSWLMLTCVEAVLHIIHDPADPCRSKNSSMAA